jgi:YHS domain-containing protein
MVPRNALHSKRWLASAAAGALLAGVAVSAQTPPKPSTPPTTASAATASATAEPRPLNTTAGRPVQPARPAPKNGGLLSFLFGSNDQQRSHPARTSAQPQSRQSHNTRPQTAQSRAGQPATHPVATAASSSPAAANGPVASQAHVQAHHKAADAKTKSQAVPAAHVADSAVADPIAPPHSFAPSSAAHAPGHQPKRPGLFSRLFGRRPQPPHHYAVPQSRANSTSRVPSASAEPAMVESRYPTARRLDGQGGVTSSVIPQGEIDEVTTSILPAPGLLGEEPEMFVGVPPAPLPANVLPTESLPALPAANEAELPQLAHEAPALLPAPESLPVPANAPELAAAGPQRTEAASTTGEAFGLPKITPAAGTQSEPAAADESPAELQEKFARIAARKGAGFKGFCPVTLRDERDLADGDPQFASTYNWQEYQFCSAEAKAKFDAHPEKYAPVLGGEDVVSAAGGEHVAGSIEFAAWFKNRLYLFNSRESMRKFVTEPARFARDE